MRLIQALTAFLFAAAHCHSGIAQNVPATAAWPPEIAGESHIYKTVDDTQLRLWILHLRARTHPHLTHPPAPDPPLSFSSAVAGRPARRNSFFHRRTISPPEASLRLSPTIASPRGTKSKPPPVSKMQSPLSAGCGSMPTNSVSTPSESVLPAVLPAVILPAAQL